MLPRLMPSCCAWATNAGGANIIDLVEALKRSLAGTPKPKEAIKLKKPRKALAGQREMLLPISGAKTRKEATAAEPVPVKAPAKKAARKAGSSARGS